MRIWNPFRRRPAYNGKIQLFVVADKGPDACLGIYADQAAAEDAAQLHAAQQVFETGEAAIFRFRYERVA